jgi:HSP20 family protein
MLTTLNTNKGYASLLNSILNDDFFYGESKSNFKPQGHIEESENNYSVQLALPGLVKEDVKVTVDDNLLIVSYEPVKEGDNNEGQEGFAFIQAFTKRYQLPKSANKEAIAAEFTNGILYLSIPKVEEVKLSKAIEIQ